MVNFGGVYAFLSCSKHCVLLHLPQRKRKIKAIQLYHTVALLKFCLKMRDCILSSKNLWIHSMHWAGFQICNRLKHRNNLSTKCIWKVGDSPELKSQKGDRPDVLPTATIWSNVSDTQGQRAPRQMSPYTAGRSMCRALWKAGEKG